MTLTETLRRDWPSITNAKLLRGALLHACRRLRVLGHVGLADEWDARVKRMPRRMAKGAINAVLLSACWELDRRMIAD